MNLLLDEGSLTTAMILLGRARCEGSLTLLLLASGHLHAGT
jgi:hypothetical protein